MRNSENISHIAPGTVQQQQLKMGIYCSQNIVSRYSAQHETNRYKSEKKEILPKNFTGFK